MRSAQLQQPVRLVVAFGYVAALLVVSVALVTDGLPPTDSLTGYWFYTGTVGLVVGSLITEPWFTRPSDALVSGLTIFLGALAMPSAGASAPEATMELVRALLMIYGLSLVAVSSVAIVFKDAGTSLRAIAESARRLVGWVGTPTVAFGALTFSVAYLAFKAEPEPLMVIVVSWAAIVGLKPLEHLAAVVQARKSLRPTYASVHSIEDPRLVVLRVPTDSQPRLGDCYDIGGVVGTVVDVTAMHEDALIRVGMARPMRFNVQQRVRLSPAQSDSRAVGYVADGTQFGAVSVRVVPDAPSQQLGRRRLLTLGLGDTQSLYMITGARVVERSEPDGRRSVVEVSATRLGEWDDQARRFHLRPWLPIPGTPVFPFPTVEEPRVVAEFAGLVPGTQYGPAINIHLAVTHNTAILGVLGAGKTSVAWELIRRMLMESVKVLVLDVSRRYETRFRDIYPEEHGREVREAIARMPRGRSALSGTLTAVVSTFLSGSNRLLILDPADFMDGGATAAQVTQHVSEAMLSFARDEYPENDPASARFALVLEEAHTLVPETGSFVESSEREATTGTVRALLQGRKYGMGCLIVTQRTANVSKSVLNQCNTVYAMRMFDDTAAGFLSNYIGSEHASLLGTLERQQAVVFGSAIISSMPLLIDIFDSQEFIQECWDQEGFERHSASDRGGGSQLDADEAFELDHVEEPRDAEAGTRSRDNQPLRNGELSQEGDR